MIPLATFPAQAVAVDPGRAAAQLDLAGLIDDTDRQAAPAGSPTQARHGEPVRRSPDFSGLREWSGRCWSVEFDADDGVQLDRVRRDPVLAVGKIEKTEPSHGHRF